MPFSIVKTLDNRSVELPSSRLNRFQSGLHGPLLLPGTPAYEEGCTLWNGMIERRPAMIARCQGVADVIHCVNFARDENLVLSVKSGGHNISGLALCDGGLTLDLSLMRGVHVNPHARIATAQAGCVLADIDRETQLYGLAAVLGFVSTTGAAGLSLGGGFGYLTRRYGWSCDNLEELEVVTADGQVVQASEEHNADLFWALRGGGGNLGVVTHFQHRLHPIGPEIWGGAIAWPQYQANEVLALFQEIVQEAPLEHTCVAVLRRAPPAPWLAKEIHGHPIVALFVCDTGGERGGEKRINTLKAFGKPVGDTLQRRTYISQQTLLDATQPPGRRYYWKSEYLPECSSELLHCVQEQAEKVVSPHSAVLLFPLSGEHNELSNDHCAAGNHDARLVINIAASWEEPADDDANIHWARNAWQAIRPFSTGGTYMNFLTEDEGGDRIQAAYGDNYEQLQAVKASWDPYNLFRVNKNIPPQ